MHCTTNIIKFLDPEVDLSCQWLTENCNAPLNQLVIKHWERSSEFRLKEYNNSQEKNLTEIFQRWPILRQTHAYKLITLDFKHIQLSNINISDVNWRQFFKSTKELSCVKDEYAKYLENLLEEENLSEGKLSSLVFCFC